MREDETLARQTAIERDGGMCVMCGRVATCIHHLSPRSHFGKKGHERLWALDNLICLCSECHDDTAHTREAREKMRERLKELRYG